MTNIEQEALTAQMMVEADGGKAFVLIAHISDATPRDGLQGFHVQLVRGISDGVTKAHGVAWIEALEREINRIRSIIE